MKVGTKVICVDDSMKPEVAEWVTKHNINWVKKNEKYTIRLFDDNDNIVDGVLLNETTNNVLFLTKWNKSLEPRFATWRFRELEKNEEELEKETDELDRDLELIELEL